MLAHGIGVRGRPRMPSESNFDHAAVSQEGGCQLNHLYGGVTHGVYQLSKRPILKRARANCHATCLSVYSSGGLQQFLQLVRVVYRYTAQPPRPAPLAEVYSSTAVYSIQLYSGLHTVYIPPQIAPRLPRTRMWPGPRRYAPHRR